MRATAVVALLLTFFISCVQAQDPRDRDRDRDRGLRMTPDWILLGERNVDFRAERDVLDVPYTEDWYRARSFRRLYFATERNDVELFRIKIVYINGYEEIVNVDRIIRGGVALGLDLAGERSYLQRIEMVYRSDPNSDRRAHIRVYGELSRGGSAGDPYPPGRDDWVRLGCRDVDVYNTDRDVLRVGQRDGRFRAIRLHARNAGVELIDVRVIYTNGAPDSIAVGRYLPAEGFTEPLDLRGRERSIDRIEMVYRRIRPGDTGGQRGQRASVCVQGLQYQR